MLFFKTFELNASIANSIFFSGERRDITIQTSSLEEEEEEIMNYQIVNKKNWMREEEDEDEDEKEELIAG